MKRDGLAILLGVSKPKKKGADSDLVDAIRDLFDALKDDDAEAGALAFERAKAACDEGYEDDDEDEES